MREKEEVKIQSREYWYKVVDFLQHNWALIDDNSDNTVTVYFFGDTAGVFDKMQFPTKSEAETGLRRNGFALYEEDKETQRFIARPEPPFYSDSHPNGLIYSSGRYWRYTNKCAADSRKKRPGKK